METKNARRKSFDVEFVIVSEDNIQEVATWCGGTVVPASGTATPHIKIADKNAINARQTKAFYGDYVIFHRPSKNFKAFGKKAFTKSFDIIEELPLTRDENGTFKMAESLVISRDEI